MAVVVPSVGEAAMLATVVNKQASEDLVLKLFTSDVHPSAGDTTGSFVEPAGGGYSAKVLTGSNWVPGTNPSSVTYPVVTFSFTGGVGNVYGYYVFQPGSAAIVAAERFESGPFNITRNGDKIKVSVRLTISSST